MSGVDFRQQRGVTASHGPRAAHHRVFLFFFFFFFIERTARRAFAALLRPSGRSVARAWRVGPATFGRARMRGARASCLRVKIFNSQWESLIQAPDTAMLTPSATASGIASDACDSNTPSTPSHPACRGQCREDRPGRASCIAASARSARWSTRSRQASAPQYDPGNRRGTRARHSTVCDRSACRLVCHRLGPARCRTRRCCNTSARHGLRSSSEGFLAAHYLMERGRDLPSIRPKAMGANRGRTIRRSAPTPGYLIAEVFGAGADLRKDETASTPPIRRRTSRDANPRIGAVF